MTFPPPDVASRPNSVPWPPLLYGAALVAGLALAWLWPLGGAASAFPGGLELWRVWWSVRLAGLVLLACGLGLDLWAMATMHQAHTNILPHRAADRLVTQGPFAWSRNPIYVGNTLALAGTGVMLLNVWLVAAAILAALATDRLAARREEAHLAARFGADFESYRKRVPRWLWR
ncbi:methyltransferase family protein [Xanthobacter sp. TB0139]|uniref:methyltransferase family protein n=1 Tax=Xanthobacter sp. TB0139 TaxID=3459178 RepID=UPI004039411C